MKPIYDKDDIQLYHADARDLIPLLWGDTAVITGPPYREDERVARHIVEAIHAQQAFIQWLETQRPPCPMHMVAVHPWLHHDGRIQTFYEFSETGVDRPGRIFRQHPVESTEHPHQFPLAIAEGFVGMCDPALTVVDPFCGAGTTLLAAKLMKRKAIGIEVNEKYIEIALRRLA